ncbi:hypothetical protein GGI02_004956 [Coemansia sp. RSA 2322]|nr:hypothetical protein GGI02_004956 [Coemansia sp. RSA 2322]
MLVRVLIANICYGFVEFGDVGDAEEAMKGCNGMDLHGERMVVEFAKGGDKKRDTNACFRCNQEGHWARDCPDARRGERSRSPRSNRNRPYSYSDERGGRDDRRNQRHGRQDDGRGRGRQSSPQAGGHSARSRSPGRGHEGRHDRSYGDRNGDRSSYGSYRPQPMQSRRDRSRSHSRSPPSRGHRYGGGVPANRGGEDGRRPPARSRSPPRGQRGGRYGDRNAPKDWDRRSADSAVGVDRNQEGARQNSYAH